MRTVSLIFLTLTMSYRPVLCASAFYVGDRLEDDYNRAQQNPPQRGGIIIESFPFIQHYVTLISVFFLIQ